MLISSWWGWWLIIIFFVGGFFWRCWLIVWFRVFFFNSISLIKMFFNWSRFLFLVSRGILVSYKEILWIWLRSFFLNIIFVGWLVFGDRFVIFWFCFLLIKLG